MFSVSGRKVGRPAVVVMSGAFAALQLLASAGSAQAGYGQAAAGTHVQAEKNGSGECDPLTKFKRSNFRHSAKIDNKFFPLPPGTQFTLQGSATGVQHTVVLIVTDLVKEINGVQTRVLWDRDFSDGVIQESELAFHAQDKEDNVWSMGEYPEEFVDGVFAGAPNTWIPGVDGAKAGVLVPGEPEKGKRFLEGKSPSIDFFDCGEVFKTHLDDVCIPAKCFDNVLVINEFNPDALEDGIQRKFYAPHVGNIKITAVNDPEAETLVLTDIKKLSIQERLGVVEAALALEARAYELKVYQGTEPMELCQDDDAPELDDEYIVKHPA